MSSTKPTERPPLAISDCVNDLAEARSADIGVRKINARRPSALSALAPLWVSVLSLDPTASLLPSQHHVLCSRGTSVSIH
ncbi:hypothetical protein SKAU_G00036890 [Synaphobranchus kaupii]|uniref:Uncharacterized protein n=1 Tax=Synaphobranchus kaupii TaxID=118154 RepID=A0A9Q1GGD9_SYNKA|nr:hypothetical protein SKAU_G00036890 [Synaphobranchus kaupii]